MNQTDSDMSEHIAGARERARLILGGEGHWNSTDDWRYALLTARNAVILVTLIWAIGNAFRLPVNAGDFGRLLLAAGIGISLFLGIDAGLRTHAEVALLDAVRVTGEHRWQVRARTLADRAVRRFQADHTPIEHRHSLFRGAVGIALLLAELDHAQDAAFPVYEVPA